MKKFKTVVKKRVCVFIAVVTALQMSFSFTAMAESYLDPAPIIEPQTSNGLQILFDNTHGETAGAADWVIDGAFSDYAEALSDEGYYVTELRQNTPITYSDLQDYDAFVIPEANIPFKTTEQNAILKYAKNGGGVFFISDHYNADRNKNRWDSSEVFNGYRRGAYSQPAKGMSSDEAASEAMDNVDGSDWLATNFGVRFRYNALGDLNATTIVDPAQCFDITNGVSSVAMHAGATIAILDPDIAKGIVYLPDGLTASDKWSFAVDEGVYNGGGVEEGAFVAIAKVGSGKAAFIGDSSAVEDASPKYRREENGSSKKTYDGFSEQDDSTLLIQLTDWLADQESYTSFSSQGIQLDTPTTLHDFETPSQSTEPQKEPWADPEAGYKWYDTTTFRSGSYGYVGSASETDPYILGMPKQIVAGQPLPLTIYFSGLTANTSYSDYKVGAYLEGGTQIGKFADIGSSFPDHYGYSDTFSIDTDDTGCASKTLMFQLDDTASGPFSIRLKQGSNTLLTDSCTISKPSTGSGVTYDAYYPSKIQRGLETAVVVKISGLDADTEVSSLTIGSYFDGGQQIAVFSTDGSNWTTNYGYSEPFNVTADENGVAYKTILMKLNENIDEGPANLRIKKGKSKMLTQTFTVG